MTDSVLVAGDVEGKFSIFFSRVAEIQRKNKNSFTYLFIVGSFFGNDNKEWNDVLCGKIKATIATYILGPIKKDHLKYFSTKSEELAPNIIYLGKHGLFSGSSGLKIAYLSGFEAKESCELSFTKNAISELITNSEDSAIDILLTAQWPFGVTKFTKVPENLKTDGIGSNLISCLAKKLKPKYHFSVLSDIYFERVPYRNYKVLQEKATHTTRFISLSSVANTRKLKWIYGFKIEPFCSQDNKDILDSAIIATECPYDDSQESNSQFFYDMDARWENQKRPFTEKSSITNKKKQKAEVSQDQCWFCLSNPEVQQQLILSIGIHSYLTIAKGGIVPDHLLILPIKHIPSSLDLPDAAEKEITKYKHSLVSYYSSQGQDVVFFERSLSSPHLQIQVVPIPKSTTQNIKNTVFEVAEEHELEFTELSEFSILKQIVKDRKPFFYIEFEMKKESSRKLIHIINKKFPLQFGRLVLARKSILDASDRIDWRSCKLSPVEEETVVLNFRKKFKPFDFTI